MLTTNTTGLDAAAHQPFLRANYQEVNSFHVVTTTTSPLGLAPVTGRVRTQRPDGNFLHRRW